MLAVSLVLLSLLAAPVLGRSLTLSGRMPFIINGDDVDYPGKYPYQASIQLFGKHFCGAVIISAEYVLSAAHCCSGTTYYSLTVGVHDMKTQHQGKPQDHQLAFTKRNPGYNKGTAMFEADICVIKLVEAIDFASNSFTATIALPNEDAGLFVGADCIITGWGNTKIGSTGAPNILQEAKTTPLSVEQCKAKLAVHPRFSEEDTNELHICIGSFGNEGSCHGDSGGPMACALNGTQVLAGLTSWGDPSCNPVYPTMYTRITPFRAWIRELTSV